MGDVFGGNRFIIISKMFFTLRLKMYFFPWKRRATFESIVLYICHDTHQQQRDKGTGK